MNQIRKGVAILVIASVAAGAWAARMGLDFERAQSKPARPALAATAQAAAGTGKPVNGSQPLTPWGPGGKLTLAGDVVELATPGAAITVTVSDGEQTVQADVNGNGYSAALSGYVAGSAPRMVTVDVRSNRVHYVSVLGSLGRLQTLAGADRHLSLDEQPTLRVSPYTTALALQVRFARNGVDAANDEEFELGMRGTDSRSMMGASYLMAAIAKGTRALPAGYSDGYALVADRNYFTSILGTVPMLANYPQYLASAPAGAPLASLQQLPQQLVMANALPYENYAMSTEATVMLQRQTADTFELLESKPISNPRYSALLDAAGDIKLQAIGTPQENFVGNDGQNYVRYYMGYTLRRLYRGSKYSQWLVRIDTEQRDQFDVYPSSQYRVLTAVDMDAWRQPGAFSTINSQMRMLPWLCVDAVSVQLKECAYGLYWRSLNGFAVDFSNKVQDDLTPLPRVQGGLLVTAPPVDAQGGLHIITDETETVFWRVDRASTVLGTLVYVSRSTSGPTAGQARVGLGFTSIRMAPEELFFNPIGEWTDGRGSVMPRYGTFGGGTTVATRLADGTGTQTRNYGSDNPFTQPLTWQAQDNVMFNRFFESNVTPGMTCAQWFQTSAYPCITRVVYFNPLLRLGTRFYGVEEDYQRTEQPDGSYTMIRRTSYPQFHDCNSGACVDAINNGTAVAAAAPRPALQARARFNPPRARFQTWGELRAAARR